MQTGEIFLVVKGACQLAHHHRVIATLRHILLTRPYQLDWRTRHLLGNIDCLSGVVLKSASATKPTAQVDFINVAIFRRQSRSRYYCSQ